MKIGTHITVLANLTGILSGTTLYFLLTAHYTYALILGAVSMVYSNLHAHYIVKRTKIELPTILFSMLSPSFSFSKSNDSLQSLVSRVEHRRNNHE